MSVSSGLAPVDNDLETSANRTRWDASSGSAATSSGTDFFHPLAFLKRLPDDPENLLMAAQEHPTNALVVENLALVGYHVNATLSRVPSYVSRDALVSAGHLALVKAARSYDADSGVPFARYAALRIRGALVDELREMDWVSRGARQRARRVTTAADELTSTLGRVPSREELAAALGVSVADVDTARGDADVRVLSIDGFDGTVAETIRSEDVSPEDSLLVGERLTYLRAAVQSLPERMRYVVEQLFFQDRPVVEVAEELGVTQSRVSQLRTEALGLLKDGMNANLDPALVPAAERPDGVAERRRRAYFAQVAARAAQGAAAAHVTLMDQVPTQGAGVHDDVMGAAMAAHLVAAG